MRETYEKVGLFYLGKDVDRDSLAPTEILTLLKNKNFTTHTAIIGMTGSGKTGLGIDMIEEVAVDNIPSIIIDPKGDMGNLCLTDPSFSTEIFSEWVADEAMDSGVDVATLAKEKAELWKSGIESWGQDSDRVARFSSVEKTIYTPGSQAGIPINLMGILELPNDEILNDSDSFVAYLKSSIMALLSLVSIEADPMESREYMLLSQIVSTSWIDRESIGVEELVGRIINPPFDKVGVLPLDIFYPDRDRLKLATKFNALLASPGFANWLKGESLDIQRLLYDESGKAKISIFSISHLSDDERMFFVTMLLNRYIAWMRLQSGSSRLRNILYMDEIYGFFPPVKNPPSKEPMITLLKQARAYGTGIILSTQNPVDLDYKGLSNIGTWCIGRLQTTQDVDRVIDGLGGKIDSSFDKKEISNLLSNLQKRTFFLKSAHLDDIRLFGTRWAMSYLKGPLKAAEISRLMSSQKSSISPVDRASTKSTDEGSYQIINSLDGSIKQYYEPDPTGDNRLTPYLSSRVEIYYFDQRRSIEKSQTQSMHIDLEESHILEWESAVVDDEEFTRLPTKEPKNARYIPIPEFIQSDKSLTKASRALKDYIYENSRLELYKCSSLRLESTVDEELSDFKAKVFDAIDEKKEQAIEKLKDRYSTKEKRLLEQLTRAKERVEKENDDQMISIINIGVSVIGALFGKTTIDEENNPRRHKEKSKVTRLLKERTRVTKVIKERGDVTRAEKKLLQIEDKIDDLSIELDDKIDDLSQKYDIDNYEITTLSIKPKKRDIDIEDIAIVWRAT